MKRIVSTIDFLAQFIIVASMALMLVIICIQIFFRFGLNSALPWPEEAVRFLMCWSLFLAAVYAQNEQSHLSLNVFVQRLPRNGGLIVRIFMNALIVVFSLAMLKGGLSEVTMLMSLKTGALRISRGIPYAAIPVTAILMVAVTLRLIVADIRKVINK